MPVLRKRLSWSPGSYRQMVRRSSCCFGFSSTYTIHMVIRELKTLSCSCRGLTPKGASAVFVVWYGHFNMPRSMAIVRDWRATMQIFTASQWTEGTLTLDQILTLLLRLLLSPVSCFSALCVTFCVSLACLVRWHPSHCRPWGMKACRERARGTGFAHHNSKGR